MSAIDETQITAPLGFYISSVNVHTDSMEAYNALTSEKGWRVRTVKLRSGGDHEWKVFGQWPGGAYIAAHRPEQIS